MKKRFVAFLLAIVAVLGASGISAYNGLNKDIKKTEMLYFDGVKKDGYRHPSIESQMKVKYQSLNNVITILDDYPELEETAEALGVCRDTVSDYFNDYRRDTVSGMSLANRTLEDTLSRAKQEMEDVSFTEKQQKILNSCFADLAGAQSMIEQSGYNEYVRDFNSGKMARFPARQLLALFGNTNHGASYFE